MQTLTDFKNNIPTRKNESYKYTNLKTCLEKFDSFDFSKTDFDLDSIRVEGALNIFIESGIISETSDKTPLSLADMPKIYKKKTEHNFEDDYLVRLNGLDTKTYQFSLDDNTVVEKPIFIFHIISNQDIHFFNSLSRFIIGKNSNLKVV